MRSSRFPGMSMMPSDLTTLPLIDDVVAGFVTYLLLNPSAHLCDSGCLAHSFAYRAFSSSAVSPLICLNPPASSLSWRFCSATPMADVK